MLEILIVAIANFSFPLIRLHIVSGATNKKSLYNLKQFTFTKRDCLLLLVLTLDHINTPHSSSFSRLRRIINLFFPEYPTRAADNPKLPTMPWCVKNH
jgi:hypothetical protein